MLRKIYWPKAADVLKKGGVVVIPSDSSFGIAAVAANNKAVEKLYSIKHREPNKPSLVIVSSLEQAKGLIEFTPLAQVLAKKYWPGGLTLVGEAKDKSFSPHIYGDGHTLAVRLPNKPQLIKLAQKVGPFILPSANLAGKPAAYKLHELDLELASRVDFIVQEKTDGNPASTLVDIREEKPKILRQGSIFINSDELQLDVTVLN